MKGTLKIVLAITSLALAALACQAVSGGPRNSDVSVTEALPVETSAPEMTAPPAATEETDPSSSNSRVLLDDDFSNSRIQWGTGASANSDVEYKDEALNFQVFTKNYIVSTTPNDNEYENIHMEMTVINHGTDPTTAFGFICDQQYPITDSHYYFAITPAGQYAIAKAALAQTDVFLTNNDEWGHSDLIAKDAPSYRLGADCGNGQLTLYVDGQEVASVEDTTYTAGRIAIFAWSGEEAATTNVSFDDFKMTQLP